ncbi:membrane protein [Tissierellia bacterium S5-A11]|nr:membrane protein [Tissierellia bacterium S5-A11]
MSRKKILGYISAIIGFLLVLAPKFIMPVCPPMEDGMFMKCHWMGNMTMGIGAVILVLAIIFIIVKDSKISLGLAISNIAIGVLEILNTHVLIGGCMKADMACRAKTIPFCTLLAGILVLVNIYYCMKERHS